MNMGRAVISLLDDRLRLSERLWVNFTNIKNAWFQTGTNTTASLEKITVW